MTQQDSDPGASAKQAASLTQPLEQYHGDLRKAAYLRRRAAYQLQADSRLPAQAGEPEVAGQRPPAPRRR